jgi:hypothetical protein
MTDSIKFKVKEMLRVKDILRIKEWRKHVKEEPYPIPCARPLSPPRSGDEISISHSRDSRSTWMQEDAYAVRLDLKYPTKLV